MTKLGFLGNFLWIMSYIVFVYAFLTLGFQVFVIMLGTYFQVSIFSVASSTIPLLVGLVLYKTAKVILTEVDDRIRIGSKELDQNIEGMQIDISKKECKLNDKGILEITSKPE